MLARLIALAMLAVGLALVPTSAQAAIPGCLNGEIVDIAATNSGNGYWLVGSDGGVFTYGDAPFFGSMGGKPLNKPVVAMAPTASGNGYWLVAADGGVFAFGDAVAPSNNPLPATKLNQPVVEATRTSGNGLALVAGDGGVFTLGGARFLGSMGGKPLNKPMVDIAATPSGNGYWLIAADGGIFAFGDAASPGNNPLPGTNLAAPIVAGARSGTAGLLLTAGDGGVFAIGGAKFQGSIAGTRLAKPVSGVAVNPTGNGYWLTALDGGVFALPTNGGGYFGNPSCNAPAPAPVPANTIVAKGDRHHERQGGRAVERRRGALRVGRWARCGGPVDRDLRGLHRLHQAVPRDDDGGRRLLRLRTLGLPASLWARRLRRREHQRPGRATQACDERPAAAR